MIDELWIQLLGVESREPPAESPDEVKGDLGSLRERFGFHRDYMDTTAEEQAYTAFRTLYDCVLSLHQSWSQHRS